MDLYDKLPPDVRAAIGDALSPINVEYLHGLMERGASASDLIKEIMDVDRDQHHGARNARVRLFGKVTTDGVVPAQPDGFKIRSFRKRRRVR
jgi:hypothetical protein